MHFSFLAIKFTLATFLLFGINLPYRQCAEGPQFLDGGKTVCSCAIVLSQYIAIAEFSQWNESLFVERSQNGE